MLDYKRRVEDLEHARTAQEVHCLRAVSRAEQIKTIFEGLADPILAIDEYDELVLANHSAEDDISFRDGKDRNPSLETNSALPETDRSC